MREAISKLVSYFKVEHLLLLVPIFGFALYDSVFSGFSSILGVLRETYPDVSTTTIQMILALPPMISIPGTLFSGFISSYVRKKYIAEFALVVLFAGGMIPVVFPDPSIYAMFACSICIGLGQGLLHPLASALIWQNWGDPDQRSRVLGFKQSFNYIGEAIVALCIGVLALTNWGNAFLIYLGIIPIFIFTHLLLPKGELDKPLVDCKKENKMKGIRELLSPGLIYLYILFFFAMMFLYGFHTNIALLVQERALGTTVEISFITSSISIASFIMGISYGKIARKFGRSTLIIGFLLLAAGMIIVSFGTSLPMIFCGGVLFGMGAGIQQISTIYYTSMIVDKKLATMAISLVISCISLGATVSPLVIGAVKNLLFGTEMASASLLVAGLGYILLALVEAIRFMIKKSKRILY